MNYFGGSYDCIVVGAGHAGCEAALASARMGNKTLLLTISRDEMALMPCNPSIGGPAKGVIVREIDALGGEMGINADATALQGKMLNTGKGPAVQALRVQSDRYAYRRRMTKVLDSVPNLLVRQNVATKLLLNDDRTLYGIETETGAQYEGKTVILCTGTYLNAHIIRGRSNVSGAPVGQMPAYGLSESLAENGFEIRRFKTGTPPRIHKRSIDFSKLSYQPGDKYPHHFSYIDNEETRTPIGDMPCYLTYTNEETHRIIRENLKDSLFFTGQLEGIGPRYCPSIENKVTRFADKDRHQLFLEPEGLNSCEYYLQGFSSALPEQVQIDFLHTVPGMENAEVLRAGYAIEYDCIDSTILKHSLESKEVSGLFFAGQINGTSGYEEAAGQGLIAGINAARYIQGKDPLILSRSEAYIGVLIDDLVTKGIKEPYRMLTSAAEYRLLLRQDNADLRLTEKGFEIGLASKERYDAVLEKKRLINEGIEILRTTVMSPKNPDLINLLTKKGSSLPTQGLTLEELLKRPELCYDEIAALGKLPSYPVDVMEEIDIAVRYAGYIEKQEAQVKKFEKLESKKIPKDINYEEIKGLSSESVEKFMKQRPESLGEASRITGITPCDISVLHIYLTAYGKERK